MSSADPFSSRFEVIGREPKHVVDEINLRAYEKLKSLLDLEEGGDGRVILVRAPRAGFGKTFLLQRLAVEFAHTHHFVRINLASGRTTDAAHVLEYVLQALCKVLPESTTLTRLDFLARQVLALGLEPLVASGEVPCQDREGALTALKQQPIETFDFHHDRAVTAHWTKSNFEILGPRLAAELTRLSGASLREASYWVELLFRFATTPPDNVERARLLFETVFRGDLPNQSESAAEERLHGLLSLLGTVTRLVLIVDDTEGLSTHPPDALALSSFLTNLSQSCPGSLVLLSVNDDIWETAFLPLLPHGLADRLSEYSVNLEPLTEEEARELVRSRAGEHAEGILEKMEWGTEPLYARHVLKCASEAWEALGGAAALGVVDRGTDRADQQGNEEPVIDLDEVAPSDQDSDEGAFGEVAKQPGLAGSGAGAASVFKVAPVADVTGQSGSGLSGRDLAETPAGEQPPGPELEEVTHAPESQEHARQDEPSDTGEASVADEAKVAGQGTSPFVAMAGTAESNSHEPAPGGVGDDSGAEGETTSPFLVKSPELKTEEPVDPFVANPETNPAGQDTDGAVASSATGGEESVAHRAMVEESSGKETGAPPEGEPAAEEVPEGTVPFAAVAGSASDQATAPGGDSTDEEIATPFAEQPEVSTPGGEPATPFAAMSEEAPPHTGPAPLADNAGELGEEESQPATFAAPGEPAPGSGGNPFVSKSPDDQPGENPFLPKSEASEPPDQFGSVPPKFEHPPSFAEAPSMDSDSAPETGPPPFEPAAADERFAVTPPPLTHSSSPFVAGPPPTAETITPPPLTPPPFEGHTDHDSPTGPYESEGDLAHSEGVSPEGEEPAEGRVGEPPSTESPFIALGGESAENNLDEVSSIFGAMKPDQGNLLDPENLKPLLEEAGSGNPPPVPADQAAFKPAEPPSSANPFAPGDQPPSSPPSFNPSGDEDSFRGQSGEASAFQPILGDSLDNPFKPVEDDSSAFRSIGEDPEPPVPGASLTPVSGSFDPAGAAGEDFGEDHREASTFQSSDGASDPAEAAEAPPQSPFNPIRLQPVESADSPFAKSHPDLNLPGGLPQQIELPPKSTESPPQAAPSPFQPGVPPASVPTATSTNPEAAPSHDPGPGPDLHLENSPEIGQDKVDELLRQFKQRYGRE